MELYARFFARSRGLVATFVVVMSVLAAVGLSRLAFDDVPRGVFESDEEGFARLERLYEDFGSDDNDVIVVLEADDWFTAERAQQLRSVVEALDAMDGVESTTSIVDVLDMTAGLLPQPLLPTAGASEAEFSTARARAQEHPLVAGRLLSEDGRTALAIARLGGGAMGTEELRRTLDRMRTETAGFLDEGQTRIRFTGVPPIRVDIYDTIRREQIQFMAIGTVFCLCLSWLLFRSVGAVIATGLPPLVGASWALGFIGLLGGRIDIFGVVLPVLVIVIGFTDSVHLMIDVRIGRDRGEGPLESAAAAIRHLGIPCALTSLTTAIGFGSLALGNVDVIRRLGLQSAGSVALTFLAVITTMPLLVSWMPRVGSSRGGASAFTRRWAGTFTTLLRAIVHRAGTVSVIGVLLTIALVLYASRLVPENRLTEALPRGSESFEAFVHCEETFGGVIPIYVQMDWDESVEFGSQEFFDVTHEVEELLVDREGLGRPLSIASLAEGIGQGRIPPRAVLAALPAGVVARFARPDLASSLVVVSVVDGSADLMGPLMGKLQADVRALDRRHDNFEFHLTGTDVVARGQLNRMILDLARSLGVAAIVIFLIIALEFRSFLLGLLSLVPNLFPLAMIGSFLVLIGKPMQMGTAVLFSVLLGLAVDDTIHFLARYRRERRSDPELAIERSFLAVGKAVLITTVVLGAAFGISSFSRVPTSRFFSALICMGLVGALIGDLLFLPALLAVRDRLRRH